MNDNVQDSTQTQPSDPPALPPEPASPSPESAPDQAPADPNRSEAGPHRRHRRRRRGRRGGMHPGSAAAGAAAPAGAGPATDLASAASAPSDPGFDSSPQSSSPRAADSSPESEAAPAAQEPGAPAAGRESSASAPIPEQGAGAEQQRHRRRRRGGRRHRRHGGEHPASQGRQPQAAQPQPITPASAESLTGENRPPVSAATPENPSAPGAGPGTAPETSGDTPPAGPSTPTEPARRRPESQAGRPSDRRDRGGRGGRGDRGGDRGRGGDRFNRWQSRPRRDAGESAGPVVQGHSSGWSNAGSVNFDDALMSEESGEELWGTDRITEQKDQISQEENWSRLKDEITDVETVEESVPQPAVATTAPVEPKGVESSHPELGLEDEGEPLTAVPSASGARPDPTAVVDATRDAEGEVIHAPAPLVAETPAPAPEAAEEPLGNKVMLINVAEGDECRLAILDGDLRLDEIYTERVSTVSHVGNIYKGVVTNIERSIQAAFVDLGLEKSGFLHISDLQPQYFMSGRNGKPMLEDVGRKLSRRERPPIQDCLRRGQEIVVQIIKEGIGSKGPTLTSYVSIPGRYLVLMPGMTRLGVSRKVEDENERRDARRALEQLNPPTDLGFIIRTQGVSRTQIELQRDLNYLLRLWSAIDKRITSEHGPSELFRESDLIIRTLRDVYTRSIGRILVDSEEVASRAREFLSIVDPEAAMAVEYYREKSPLFHRFRIEDEIGRIHDRRVPLPAGGGLVIDSTEALVAIDVNSGKSRQQQDAEETAYRTNLEAAVEIARQLRLRDLGGVIICDFIDMRHERHRLAVERCLFEAMRKDRARTKVLPISRFGIIEMTRQRMRPSLKRTMYMDCPSCKNTGVIKTSESVCLDAMRHIRQMLQFSQVACVEITVHPDVAFLLLNQKRKPIMRLEIETGKHVVIKGNRDYWPDQTHYAFVDRTGKYNPVEETFIFNHGHHGPVHATPVGPLGMAVKPSTIHGPQVVGFEPISAEEQAESEMEAEGGPALPTEHLQELPAADPTESPVPNPDSGTVASLESELPPDRINEETPAEDEPEPLPTSSSPSSCAPGGEVAPSSSPGPVAGNETATATAAPPPPGDQSYATGLEIQEPAPDNGDTPSARSAGT